MPKWSHQARKSSLRRRSSSASSIGLLAVELRQARREVLVVAVAAHLEPGAKAIGYRDQRRHAADGRARILADAGERHLGQGQELSGPPARGPWRILAELETLDATSQGGELRSAIVEASPLPRPVMVDASKG